jgi:hypothetical protein
MMVIAGCGGGSSSTATGGHAGGGATGAGGSAGATGAGGSGATGGAAGLPTCAIPAPPSSDGGACATLTAAGPLVTSVPVNDNFQGGVVEDGSVDVKGAGGTVLDGGYDLIRWENGAGGKQTRRTIRVFNDGTYVQWDAAVASGDAGFSDVRYDTLNSISGHTFALTSFPCTASIGIHSYGYTATGDDLVFFDYDGGSDGNANVISVDTYRRTCVRP